MTDFFASYPPSPGGGVSTYANFAAFPSAVSAGNGALAIALDTDTLYISNGTVWEILASPSTVINIGAIDGQPASANGASISGNTLYMQSSDATHPGLINNTAQTIAGQKTFSSAPNLSSLTASLPLQLDASKNVTSTAIDLNSSQITGTLQPSHGGTGVTSLGNLTEATSAVLTISSGTGALVHNSSIQVLQSGTSQSGYLSSTDWNTFNNKSPAVLPTTNQIVYVNFLTGSDTTGNGSYGLPFQTVAKAMTTITDASSNKPYTISLLAARQIETGDLFIKPYTFIVGSMQRASYIRVNGGSIKPDPTHSSVNSWVGFGNIYIGGGTAIAWDLQALGGSNCTFVIQNCTVSGNLTYKGRSGGGGDFIEIYTGIVLGNTIFDSVFYQVQSIEFGGTLTVTNTQSVGGFSGTLNNIVFDSNVSATSAGTLFMNNCAYNAGVALTTSGTNTIDSFRGLPTTANRTLSGGTTVVNIDDATVTAYTPATSGNWSSVPTNVSTALDGVALASNTASATKTGVLSSTDWSTFNSKQPAGSYITALTGDVTASGPGSAAASLVATTNGTLTTLSALTTASSLATVGTITSGTWSATTIAINKGGTGQTTASAAFNALSPITTTGDMIYSASGATNSRLPVGSTGNVLTVSGGVPAWSPPATSGTVTSVAMTVPSVLSVSGSPITSSGTLAVTYSGTALPVANGGTGLTAGTSGGILGYTATGTLASSALLTANQIVIGGGAGATPSALAAGSQFQVLVMGASNPGYGQVNLAQSAAITGTLPIGNGGTGQTTANAAFNALSPATTKGDMIYSNATPIATRLAIGSTGQFLGVSGGIPAWSSFTATTISFVTRTSHTGGFSANASGTYTVPAGVLWLWIRMQGAGGGGGGSSNSNVSTSGGTGGDTTFGTSLHTASGGVGGGNAAHDTYGGAGGSTTIGAGADGMGQTGGYGHVGNNASGFFSFGGLGGSAAYGGAGGAGVGAVGLAGMSNTGGGGGGGGTGVSAQYGGHGGGAGGYIDIIINSSIAATYAYAVGAAGTAGTASGAATTFNGAAGAPGFIFIVEGYT